MVAKKDSEKPTSMAVNIRLPKDEHDMLIDTVRTLEMSIQPFVAAAIKMLVADVRQVNGKPIEHDDKAIYQFAYDLKSKKNLPNPNKTKNTK